MELVFAAVKIILVLTGIESFAQKSTYKEGNSFSLAVNVGAHSFANSLAWTHFYAIGELAKHHQ